MKKGYTDQYVFQSALSAYTALENLLTDADNAICQLVAPLQIINRFLYGSVLHESM